MSNFSLCRLSFTLISRTNLGNYVPVLEIGDKLVAKYPADTGEAFPENWTDPLELYGVYLWELIDSDVDLGKERMDLQGLIDDKGPEWVWQCRQT